jgi:hypothetical protein
MHILLGIVIGMMIVFVPYVRLEKKYYKLKHNPK